MDRLKVVMAIIGHTKISSIGQSIEMPLDKFKHCNKGFHGKRSNTARKQPLRHACLEYVREVD